MNYYKRVAVQGNCAAPQSVVLNGVLWGQDHAIVTVSCLQAQGVATRQFTIMDLYFVYFSANPNGAHIAAQENSKINCLDNIYANGNAAAFMSASGLSTIIGGCTQTTSGFNFSTAYSYAAELSIVDQSDATFVGTNTGPKCFMSDSSLIPAGENAPGMGACARSNRPSRLQSPLAGLEK